MELNIATLNVRGLQSKGSWRQFIKQMIPWARRHRINALCIQEHNLQKSRKEQLKYDAHEVGWNLIIGFAAARSARGGCAILLLKEIEVEVEHEVSEDLIALRVKVGPVTHEIATVYVPVTTNEKLAFIPTLKNRLKEKSIVGGDWNCVPDVTLDRRGPTSLNNPNVGAALLAEAMEDINVLDVRREQLGSEFEHTRKDAMTAARLDRWYLPYEGYYTNVLYTIKVVDDLLL